MIMHDFESNGTIGPMSLRPAKIEDARPLFEWRNAPETRQYFNDVAPIEWSAHVTWLQNLLRDHRRHLLIGMVQDRPVGVLRYDVEDDVAVVSIYLVPGQSGRGLGTELLRRGAAWARNSLPSVTRLAAQILPENVGSIRAFTKAGFIQTGGRYELTIRFVGSMAKN
jgi:RimJ/RimL family protein N-acetyltransferase